MVSVDSHKGIQNSKKWPRGVCSRAGGRKSLVYKVSQEWPTTNAVTTTPRRRSPLYLPDRGCFGEERRIRRDGQDEVQHRLTWSHRPRPLHTSEARDGLPPISPSTDHTQINHFIQTKLHGTIKYRPTTLAILQTAVVTYLTVLQWNRKLDYRTALFTWSYV